MERSRAPIVALLLLAPLCGEVLSGSTPILEFLKPASLLLLVSLYGLGALLVRELVRSRGLGWANVLVLGAAYGVLEEGLVVTSWQNPLWPDAAALGDRGRLLEVSWIWASGLTVFHAVVSIGIPIVLAEALFPARANEPWLSPGGRRLVAILLAVVSLVELALFGFAMFAGRYSPPALGYAIALAIALVLARLGLRPLAGATRRARAPSRWRLRGFGLLAAVAFFGALWISPGLVPVGAVPVGLVALVAWVALVVKVRAWSADPAWGAAERLALASGVLSFFILLAPLLEANGTTAGKVRVGMTAFALLAVAFLAWLARRVESGPPAPAPTAPA